MAQPLQFPENVHPLHRRIDLDYQYPLSGLYRLTITVDHIVPEVWTLIKGKKHRVGGKIVIHPRQRSVSLTSQTTGTRYDLPYWQIEAYGYYLWKMSQAPTQYATITDNDWNFKQLYSVTTHPICYANGPRNTESMTCVHCSIVLPRRYMQIDHQRPQSGGTNEAVAKAFRVLGLTKAPPHGRKCTQLARRIEIAKLKRHNQKMGFSMLNAEKGLTIAPQEPGLVAVTPKNLRPPEMLSGVGRADRYTLNEPGMIYYSLIAFLRTEKWFEDYCLHSLANLRPLCGPCNGERGRKVLKFG